MASQDCRKPRFATASIAGFIVSLALATAAPAQPSLTFTEFAVARGGRPVIVSGSDDALWYSEFDRIGRITTEGAMSTFLLPDDGQSYPNGRGIVGLTSGPDGALWFTESANGRIARITTDKRLKPVRAGTAGIPPLHTTFSLSPVGFSLCLSACCPPSAPTVI